MAAENDLSDRYRLRRRLASGGMGEVWLADDLVLGREVAVKLLAVGSAADGSAVERFDREARTMAALQHPNIVTVFDSGTRSGGAFIVMELLAGPTLAQLLAERGPLPEPEVVRLGGEIAAGLGAAHLAGVIHRDIKPSNLMFSSSGTLKILDFGIARLSQNTAAGLTATDAVIGSAPYLSPEQAAGSAVDERSDLYALGCVLMALLTGRPPFTADHPMAVLHQQIHSDPPALRELQPAASPALEALVTRLLSKRPDDRPATAGEVETQLAAISAAGLDAGTGATATVVLPLDAPPAAAAEPAATRVYPPVSTPATVAPARPPAAQQPPVAPRPNRGRARALWLAAAALVVVAVLAALALTTLPGRGTDETAGTPTPGPSSTPPPPTPTAAAPTTPPPSPATTQPTTATAAPADPLAAVRAAVDAVVADGQLDPRNAEDLGRRLDDLAGKLGEGGKDVDKQIKNLTKHLSGLVKKGELTQDGFRRIQAALDQL